MTTNHKGVCYEHCSLFQDGRPKRNRTHPLLPPHTHVRPTVCVGEVFLLLCDTTLCLGVKHPAKRSNCACGYAAKKALVSAHRKHTAENLSRALPKGVCACVLYLCVVCCARVRTVTYRKQADACGNTRRPGDAGWGFVGEGGALRVAFYCVGEEEGRGVVMILLHRSWICCSFLFVCLFGLFHLGLCYKVVCYGFFLGGGFGLFLLFFPFHFFFFVAFWRSLCLCGAVRSVHWRYHRKIYGCVERTRTRQQWNREGGWAETLAAHSGLCHGVCVSGLRLYSSGTGSAGVQHLRGTGELYRPRFLGLLLRRRLLLLLLRRWRSLRLLLRRMLLRRSLLLRGVGRGSAVRFRVTGLLCVRVVRGCVVQSCVGQRGRVEFGSGRKKNMDCCRDCVPSPALPPVPVQRRRR